MSKTTFILVVMTFYVFVIGITGLMGVENLQQFQEPEEPADPGIWSALTDIFSYVAIFFSGLGFTLSTFGVLGNTLLFLPLGLTLGWVIFTLVAPGGS